MQIINLTPHALNLIVGGKTITIPPSGTVARAATKREQVGTISIDGAKVPVNKTTFGKVEGLPEPKANTAYVVSAIVAQAVPHRDDILIVDDAVRDNEGRIIGARALARV